MRRCVTEETLQLECHFQQAVDRLVLGPHFLETRFDIQCLGQGHRIGRVGRDQLGELVDQAKGQLQHSSDITHHGTRLQSTKRDDLSHTVMAIFILDITNDLAATFLAEIDVEVGHGHTFGVEETLEQKAKPQRVQIGNRQRVGDK